jgi:5-methylcytosine-specific restriction endonuclease McrA
MKRTVPVGLCVLVLLAATSSPLMASSKGADPTDTAQAGIDAAGSEIVSPAPEATEPLSAEEEQWATRYPREYRDWKESVHGRAYRSGDAKAPGCTGCHDDPEKSEMRTAAFRLSIPSRCADCHNDAKLMREHDVATDVYSSYRADYHGLTIGYYRAHDPSVWRYEAVCSDCHGSHAVYKDSDPRSSVAPTNLLGTCQQCHSGAEANFASITAGHFRTDRESSLLTYYIELIYQVLIPTLIGLMAAYVGLDISHRLRRKFARAK